MFGIYCQTKGGVFLNTVYHTANKTYLNFNEEENLTNNCKRLDKNLDEGRNAKPVN